MEVDIIFGLSIAAVVLFFVAQVSRIIRSTLQHKTIRQALEKGQQLTPELIDQFNRAPAPGATDQRIGFVLVALGLALMAAGAIAPPPADFRGAAAIAMFPLFVGVALLLRLKMAAKREAE